MPATQRSAATREAAPLRGLRGADEVVDLVAGFIFWVKTRCQWWLGKVGRSELWVKVRRTEVAAAARIRVGHGRQDTSPQAVSPLEWRGSDCTIDVQKFGVFSPRLWVWLNHSPKQFRIRCSRKNVPAQSQWFALAAWASRGTTANPNCCKRTPSLRGIRARVRDHEGSIL